MQRCFCRSLQAHPAASRWPGFAGNISRSITHLQTYILFCRIPSLARERSQSSGANPSLSVWVSPCAILCLSQKGQECGGREGKGNRKRVWAPGEQHEALPHQSVGSNNLGSCSADGVGCFHVCVCVPSRFLRLRPRSESEPRHGNLIQHCLSPHAFGMVATQFSSLQVQCDAQQRVPPPVLGLGGGCRASAPLHVVPIRDPGCTNEQAKQGKAEAAESSRQGCQVPLLPAVPD